VSTSGKLSAFAFVCLAAFGLTGNVFDTT